MNSKIEIGKPGWAEAHLELYLRTDGAEGHLLDFSVAGGPAQTPCLILKTVGRKSGEARLHPLIYGEDGGRFVIVASKGGAPEHPAWYVNLVAQPQVEFQVGDQKWRGVARTVEGGERERLFAMMAGIFPPYLAYKARTEREIPVVVLEPGAKIEGLR
ncbi:MAG TPA: nitroreductase family deazaflavin-dependent oxidoreductase [Caulobacteraceae bacterium]